MKSLHSIASKRYDRRMEASLARISKFLSLVLRHKPESIGLSLDEAGWVAISDLLEASNRSGTTIDFDLLLQVVHENDKQRFAISPNGKSIRANQGHSIDIDLGLTPTLPPPILYHGTVTKFLDGIRSKGLLPGKRQYVHLSADTHTAEIVGKRRGEPIVLLVNAEKMANDAFTFYVSQNGVWLTQHIPIEYIQFP